MNVKILEPQCGFCSAEPESAESQRSTCVFCCGGFDRDANELCVSALWHVALRNTCTACCDKILSAHYII